MVKAEVVVESDLQHRIHLEEGAKSELQGGCPNGFLAGDPLGRVRWTSEKPKRKVGWSWDEGRGMTESSPGRFRRGRSWKVLSHQRSGEVDELHRPLRRWSSVGCEDAISSSWLLVKRSGLMNAPFWQWKRRFVKLDSEQLLLYADDGPGAEFKGTVPIRGVSMSLAKAKQTSKSGALYAFTTTDGAGTTVTWAAFTRLERARWLKTLQFRGASLDQEAEAAASRADDASADPEEDHDEEATPSSPAPMGLPGPLSVLFGERTPAQAWGGRPPKKSWASASQLPGTSARDLGAAPAPSSVADVGRPEGILRRPSRSATLPPKPLSESEEPTMVGPMSAGASSATTKTVRFDHRLAAKKGEVVSPSISSAVDSPGSTRSANTITSSVSTPVSRGQAAGKRVVSQWLQKEAHLGSGTFGNVYAGTYFNQKVAIKELIVQDLSEESLEEFEREADLHYHLRHANVILLLCYNVEPSNGPACMVMELAQCSLFDVLHRNAPLPQKEDRDLSVHTRLRILEDVATGLMFLHTLDIMHLDLKSLNLLLDGTGTVKLADFGLSVVKSEIEGSQGKAIGSLPYMAPELMVDDPYPDKACDVYSFYVVVWEVVCRQQPHDGKSPAWIMKFASRRKKQLEVPKHVGCPQRLEALMKRCADFDPSRRPTMEACQRAISDIRADPIAPSLMRVELPENALFTCEVIAEDGVVVLDAPRAKLDDEDTYSPASSSVDTERRAHADFGTGDDTPGRGVMSPVSAGSTATVSQPKTPKDAASRDARFAKGYKFYVEAHVAAANGRPDGEDQVYLKLANEESYVAAFGADGAILVRLVDTSIGAERLAVEARERGIGAVVEGLLFHLALCHAEAILRLLACIFEILAAPNAASGASAKAVTLSTDEGAMSDAMRIKACRRVVAALNIFRDDAHVQLAGVSAVVNLALDVVGRAALAKFGACHAIIAALKRHGDDGDRAFELRRVCVEAILNILSDDANAPALRNAGATRALMVVVTDLAEASNVPNKPPDVRRRERRVAARAWTSLARLATAEQSLVGPPLASSAASTGSRGSADDHPQNAVAYLPRASIDVDDDHCGLDEPFYMEADDDVPDLLRAFDGPRLSVLTAAKAARIISDRSAAARQSGDAAAGYEPEDDEDEVNAVVIIDEVEAAECTAVTMSSSNARQHAGHQTADRDRSPRPGGMSGNYTAAVARPRTQPCHNDDCGRGAAALLAACCHAMQAFATMPAREDGKPSIADLLLDAGAATVLEQSLRRALDTSDAAKSARSRQGLAESDDLARRTCAAIMALAASSDRARVLLGDAGVCEAAVEVARAICTTDTDLPRDDIARLRYYAVGALSNLAFSSTYNKDRLDNCGALRAIAACAEAANSDLEQQRLCCRAFCTLGTLDVTDNEEDPRRLHLRHLRVVPQAMFSHEDPTLQHLGCAAIINLAAEPRYRRALGVVDGCEAVAAALKNHPTDARVQEYGFRAAVYLARDDPINRERFHAHGVRRLATAAAKLFTTNPSVLAWAHRLQKEL